MNLKFKIIIGFIAAPVIILLLFYVLKPIDSSKNIKDYYKAMKNPPLEAKTFGEGGSYFIWKSTLKENHDFKPLQIFYRTFGSRKNPAILMVHGFPTSSYDFKEIIDLLKNEYFIVVLDTPGYGFSDKPKEGFKYTIFEDAKIVDHLLTDIVKMKKFSLLTHDKGDSVGFALLQLYQSEKKSYKIIHHIILNGGIYLPLANLSIGQYLMLSPLGPIVTGSIVPSIFTKGFQVVYDPPMTDKEQRNMASIFAYQDGTGTFHQTIKYLNERRKHEVTWLKTLGMSDVPVTLIWGMKDPIAKTAIADFVWKNYLRKRKSPAQYFKIPCASHYPQNDQPEIIAQLIRYRTGNLNEMSFKEMKCKPFVVK